MRKTIILCLFALLSNLSFTQSINVPASLNIFEGKEKLDDVERNGFGVDLVGDEKEIIKAFEDFLENEKYEVKSLFKKISAEDILVPSFSEKHFNLNAEIRETGSSLVLWLWVNFGTDLYANTAENPIEAEKCKKLLKDFAIKYYSDFINADLEAASELVEKSREDLDDFNKDIEGLNKEQLKVKKEKEKLRKEKLKLEEELAELNLEIKENKLEMDQKDAEMTKLTTDVDLKTRSQSDLKSKIQEQEKTITALKAKLEQVKKF